MIKINNEFMTNNFTIAILLSTYNSELYLKELFLSIINQTYEQWILYIRDDGSSDGTIDIINKFLLKDKRVYFFDDTCRMGDAKKSFMYLLENVDAKYYMFCDHDDIWLPCKIMKTIQAMLSIEVKNKSVPIIIHSDLCVVDENLRTICTSFWKYSHISPKYKSYNFFCAYNNLTGCTMMINQSAKNICLLMPDFAPMHDYWIGLVVSFYRGIIYYINEPLILYRQHSNHVIGAQHISLFKKFFALRSIYYSNKRIYRTICVLKKKNILAFVLNKLYFRLKILIK